MKIFLTGGTGLIGTTLVERLLSTGHEITVLSRKISKIETKFGEKVHQVEGDVTESGDWQTLVSGHNAIINLVGENILRKRWTKKQKKKLRVSRIDSGKKLLEAVKISSEPPSIFITPSGVDYYPADNDKIFSEDDNPGIGFLSKLCQDWEIKKNEIKNLGLRSVTLRFGVAFTPNGKGAELMFLPHKLFFGGWIGSGKQPLTWIHIEDMVGCIIWALENEVEGVYNATAPDQVRFKEVAVIGGKILHRWTWTWLPGFILRILLGERANVLLKGRFISSQKIMDAGYTFKFTKIKLALEDIL